jgi:hypothetical protein
MIVRMKLVGVVTPFEFMGGVPPPRSSLISRVINAQCTNFYFDCKEEVFLLSCHIDAISLRGGNIHGYHRAY